MVVDKPNLKKLSEKDRRVIDKTYVTTPVEIIDFIEKSVAEIAKSEFGTSLDSENVTIIDPFAGEGQFLERAFQNDTISKDHKSDITQYEMHPERAAEAKKNVPKTVKTVVGDTFKQ